MSEITEAFFGFNMEEQFVIEQFQSGNRAVFDVLVRQYQERLYAFALKLLQNHQDAEDLSQETFVRAYQNLDRLRGQGSFRSWLFAIMVNCYRSHRRRPRLTVVDVPPDEVSRDQSAPEDAALRSEAQTLAKEALNRLPPKQKLVLVLRTFEQMSYQEISDITGMSLESVKANLCYARNNLRNQLQGILL